MSLDRAEVTDITVHDQHTTIRLDQSGLDSGGHAVIRVPNDIAHGFELGKFYALTPAQVDAPEAPAPTGAVDVDNSANAQVSSRA